MIHFVATDYSFEDGKQQMLYVHFEDVPIDKLPQAKVPPIVTIIIREFSRKKKPLA
jgi:hypothetical protein